MTPARLRGPFDVDSAPTPIPPRGDVAGRARPSEKPRKRWRRSPALGDHRARALLLGGGARRRTPRRRQRCRSTRCPASSGMTADAAAGAGRRVRLEDRPPGQSTTQRPRGKSSVRIPRPAPSSRRARTFTLVVSRGPTPVAIPDLTGMSDGQAGEALKNAGLVVVTPVTEEYDENVPGTSSSAGIRPAPRCPRARRSTSSSRKGPAPRQVPQISGTFDEAKAALAGVQLKAKQESRCSATTSPRARSCRPQPAAGDSVARGATVVVNVSKGPDLVAVPRSCARSSTRRSRSSRTPGSRRARCTGRRRAGRSRHEPRRGHDGQAGQRGRHLPRLAIRESTRLVCGPHIE